MTAAEFLAEVRKLHQPDPVAYASGGRWLYCDGCDLGPHAEDRPSWPCRTAELVYTPEEIKALEEAP